jgi:hypothetical protein
MGKNRPHSNYRYWGASSLQTSSAEKQVSGLLPHAANNVALVWPAEFPQMCHPIKYWWGVTPGKFGRPTPPLTLSLARTWRASLRHTARFRGAGAPQKYHPRSTAISTAGECTFPRALPPKHNRATVQMASVQYRIKSRLLRLLFRPNARERATAALEPLEHTQGHTHTSQHTGATEERRRHTLVALSMLAQSPNTCTPSAAALGSHEGASHTRVPPAADTRPAHTHPCAAPAPPPPLARSAGPWHNHLPEACCCQALQGGRRPTEEHGALQWGQPAPPIVLCRNNA